MEAFLQLLFNGLAMGAIYALVALGFVLIVNAVDILNFAQGELLMLGAFLAFTFTAILGLPVLAGLIILIPATALIGYAFQLVTYYPLRDKPLLTVIIATIGVAIALQSVAQLVWGVLPRPLEPLIPTAPARVGGLIFLPYQLLIMGVTGVLMVAQHFFFARTRYGRWMRATAQDMEAARMLGIPVRHTIAMTFVLSTVLAGVGGMLMAPLSYVSAEMGLPVLIKAFAGTVIGGFGSIPGAIVGALFVGVAETMVAGYISSLYKDAVAFALLILVLYVRPQGFFGEVVAEKI